MIFFLVTRINTEPVERFLKGWGKPLAPQVTIVRYEELLGRKPLKAGTYLFCDTDLLSPAGSKSFAELRERLAQAGPKVRVLNHPARSMRRFELLRTLYEQGINQFNVYRMAEDARPARFPVFLREEHFHRGGLTGLLDTEESLNAAVEDLVRKGQKREALLAVEFCDTSDRDGVFRKYAAFRIGDRIVPRHVFFDKEWMLKHSALSEADLARDERHRAELAEELHYVETNPHEQQLRPVFELANIEYGRIDYGLLDGKVQIWEINTNPQIVGRSDLRAGRRPLVQKVAQQILGAFQEIDTVQFGYSVSSQDF